MKPQPSDFDFHCHIDLFPDPVAAIACRERSRILTIAVTTTPKAWVQNRRWTTHSKYVHAALGLHPELVGDRHSEIDLLAQLLPEAAFLGEIGLDGSPKHRKHWPAQKDVFVRVLNCAERLGGRVASIHSRRAAREVLLCIAEHTTPQRVLPILHWYSDSVGVARQALEQGCHFSINHRMLNSDLGVTLVRELPSDRILTETDAPFGDKSSRAKPRQFQSIVNQLADIRGVSAAAMIAILAENAARVLAFANAAPTYSQSQSKSLSLKL
jgi:TatD DNase family protein